VAHVEPLQPEARGLGASAAAARRPCMLPRTWQAVCARGQGGMPWQRHGHAGQARAPGGARRACSGSPAWPWRAQSPGRSGRTAPRTRQSAPAPGPRPRTTCAPCPGAEFAHAQARPLRALRVRPPCAARHAALHWAAFSRAAPWPAQTYRRPNALCPARRAAAARAARAQRAVRAGRGRTTRW